MGKFNHDLYLSYDHTDVYIATSMRRRFDFWNISRLTEKLLEYLFKRSPSQYLFILPRPTATMAQLDKGSG